MTKNKKTLKSTLMRISIILIFLIALFSCNNKKNNRNHWIAIKDSFYTQRLNDFIVDIKLSTDFYNRLNDKAHSFKDKILDSLFHQPVYLYSWHKQDSTGTVFSIVTEGMGESIEVKLLSFDKNDKLISNIILAKKGGEIGSYSYESRSHFISLDTFVTLHTRVYRHDELTLKRLSRIIGDTLKYVNTIGKDGIVTSKIIDSIITSQKFKNKNGFVTEEMIKQYY